MNLKKFKGKKILITGSTGFKGAWLCYTLKLLGADVYGIGLKPSTKPNLFHILKIDNLISQYYLDIRKGNLLKNKVKKIKPDYIFHLAAQALVSKSFENSKETFEINTFGTLNLLESIRELNQPCISVFITSDKVYRNSEWEWGYREVDKLGGYDPYSGSKSCAELVIFSYFNSFLKLKNNCRIGIGRAGNVIGGGDWSDDRIVPDCIKAWSLNNVSKIRNKHSTRPWQHVLEPISGYLKLAIELGSNKKINGEAFNFGPSNDSNFTVESLVREMAQNWDNKKWTTIELKKQKIKESKLLKLNCDKAFFHLKWKPKWNFEKTALETVNWYKTYYSKDKKTLKKLTENQILKYFKNDR